MALVNITGFQRMRRLQAQKAAKLAPEVEVQPNTSVEQEKPEDGPNEALNMDEMTKDQLIAELEARGIGFNKRDNKETLKGLLLNGAN